MNITVSSLLRSLAAAMALVWSASSASAILITFESSQGYTAGSALTGQPSSGTAWGGTANFYNVVAGAGVSGSNGAQSPATYAGGSQFFLSSAADLGVAIKTPTGRYTFSLAVTMNGNPNGLVGDTGTRIELFGNGSQQAVELRILGNGRLRYDDGSQLVNVVNSGGAAVNLAQGATATFEGVINYDTATYSLTVNGVVQGTAIPFSDVFVHSASTVGRFEIEHFTASGYRQITLDNLSMEVVPEPGTAGLLGIGLGGAAVLATLRSRSRRKDH